MIQNRIEDDLSDIEVYFVKTIHTILLINVNAVSAKLLLKSKNKFLNQLFTVNDVMKFDNSDSVKLLN